MAKHNDLGNLGEDKATSFLAKNGYTILERQWRYKHKEIDIIAQKQNTVIFVEVKTRSSNYWGEPSEFVTQNKINFMIEAAAAFVEERNFDGEIQFDVISIKAINNIFEIEHIENAFEAE